MADSPRDGRGRRETPGSMDAMGIYPNQKMVDVSAKADGEMKGKPNKKGFNSGEEVSNKELYKSNMKVPKKVCIFPD